MLTFHIVAMGVLVSPLLAAPVPGQDYWAIQVLSGSQSSAVQAAYLKLAGLPMRRIERRGGLLVLRAGYWFTRQEAEQYLPQVLRAYPGAYVRVVAYRPDAIMLPTAEPAAAGPIAEPIIPPSQPLPASGEAVMPVIPSQLRRRDARESSLPLASSVIDVPPSDADLDLIPVMAEPATAMPIVATPWRGWLESEPRQPYDQAGRRLPSSLRFSGEVHYEQRFAIAGVDTRAVFADRLDHLLIASRVNGDTVTINNLKEAFLSSDLAGWQIDLGRINDKYGAAVVASPLDIFKRNAVASRISDDPQVLQNIRLGSFMARLQRNGDWGSVGLAYSPRLKSGPLDDDASGISLRLDRTNNRDRTILRLSPKSGDNFASDFLLSKEAGRPALVGFSLSRSFGQATVVYLDWAGGKRPTLADDARLRIINVQPSSGFAYASQYALGFTVTTASNFTVRTEAAINGAADDRSMWAMRRHAAQQDTAAAQLLGAMRHYSQDAGEPLTRQSWFVRFDWTDFPWRDVDLAAFLRVNGDDASRLSQVSAAWRLSGRTTLQILFEQSIGAPDSEFGANGTGKLLQINWTHYF